MTRYVFHPEAKSEFQRVIDYYEEQEKSLGQQFAVEVYATSRRESWDGGTQWGRVLGTQWGRVLRRDKKRHREFWERNGVASCAATKNDTVNSVVTTLTRSGAATTLKSILQ